MNEDGDQAKFTEVPLTDPFRTTESPRLIFLSGPASATGIWFTNIVRYAESLQPYLFAISTLYSVVLEGEAIGFGTTSLDKPSAGVHCQVTLSDADADNCSVEPSQRGETG